MLVQQGVDFACFYCKMCWKQRLISRPFRRWILCGTTFLALLCLHLKCTNFEGKCTKCDNLCTHLEWNHSFFWALQPQIFNHMITNSLKSPSGSLVTPSKTLSNLSAENGHTLLNIHSSKGCILPGRGDICLGRVRNG